MPEYDLLDNPIWNALCTEHAPLSLGSERARRYLPEIGPLSGIPDQAAESYESLRALAGSGAVVLFSIEPIRVPPGWKIIRDGPIVQMIRTPESLAAAGAADLRLDLRVDLRLELKLRPREP